MDENYTSKDVSASETDKAIKLTDKVLKPLKKYREQFEPNWKKETEAYYGNIWRNKNAFRPYENTIFEIIEGAVPLLTDSMTSVIAQTDNKDREAQAHVLTKSFEWVLQDQKFIIKKQEVVRNSLIGGPGWIHVYWDRYADNGNGRQILEVLHWSDVWLSGNGSLIEDCHKAVFDLKRDRDWLIQQYPAKKAKLKKAKAKDSFDNKKGGQDNDGYQSFDISGKAKRKAPVPYQDEDMLCLRVTYVKDYSMVKISEEHTAEEIEAEHNTLMKGEGLDVTRYQDHKGHAQAHLMKRAELYAQLDLPPEADFDTAAQVAEVIMEQAPESGADQALALIKVLEDHIEEHGYLKRENPKGEMPKYSKDNWRVIKKVGTIVVHDGDPEEDHDEIPLVPWYAYKDSCVYGISETRNLYDSQSMQAVMGYKVYKGLQKVANPEKIVEIETGLTHKDITNEDGAVYMIPQGTKIENVPPGVVSEQVVRFGESRVDKMKDISGTRAASDGKIPHPNSSALLVDKLEQQALGRVRLKDRNDQYYSMYRLASLVIANNISFWTTEKNLRLNNGEGKLESVVFNPAEVEDLEYEITIAPGSMAGVDKQAFNAYMLKLVELEAITVRQLLEVVELPKKEKILASLDQNDQVRASVEELQGQLQKTQIDNLKLKAQINPELLSTEEKTLLEEVMRQEANAQLTQME